MLHIYIFYLICSVTYYENLFDLYCFDLYCFALCSFFVSVWMSPCVNNLYIAKSFIFQNVRVCVCCKKGVF